MSDVMGARPCGPALNSIIDNPMSEPIPSISATELKAMLDRGDDLELVDVREPAEHQIVRLPGARLVPLNALPQEIENLDPDKTQVVICRVGNRSAMAVAFLRERDYDAVNLTGGILAWIKEVDPSLTAY
jgi:sulfur-carrier protein adenylyltransferase/sulfurtransferase